MHQKCITESYYSFSSTNYAKFFFLQLIFYLIIYGCTGSSLLRAGFLQLQGAGATLCCGAWASRGGFPCCGAWALGAWASVVVARGSRAQAQQLWRMGLVAPWHVGSPRTRIPTGVPCIGRRILNHCTTREVPSKSYSCKLIERYFKSISGILIGQKIVSKFF